MNTKLGFDLGYGNYYEEKLGNHNIHPTGLSYSSRLSMEVFSGWFAEIFYRIHNREYDFIHDSIRGRVDQDQVTYGLNFYLIHSSSFHIFLGLGQTTLEEKIVNNDDYTSVQKDDIQTEYGQFLEDKFIVYNLGARFMFWQMSNLQAGLAVVYATGEGEVKVNYTEGMFTLEISL
ncbi:MAG: hypothetical protein H6620_07110 [Halobacteriovoraceae bacterium]|nr:hypothetical protein [Halobacteriovoraceae bacterium]